MTASRRMLSRFAFSFLVSCAAFAPAGVSSAAESAAGSAALDGVESIVVRLEQMAAEAAQDMVAGVRSVSLVGPLMSRASARLDSLLRVDSTDVRANILYARLGLAAVLCTPMQFDGSGLAEKPLPASAQDLVRALDRALRKEPDNAAIHYWKGVVFAAPIVQAQTPLARPSLDFEAGVRAMKRAVELAPDRLEYREVLANMLLDLGRMEEAREALRPALSGQHPAYRLLMDWSSIPRPPGAIFDSDLQRSGREIVEGKYRVEWASAHVDAFVVPMRGKDLQAFYARSFPNFEFYLTREEKSDGMSLRALTGRLVWEGDSLKPAPDRGQAMSDDVSGIVLSAGEVIRPSREFREQNRLPAGDVFCSVTLVNTRGLASQSPEPAGAATEFSGTYEAVARDDRATLEFMEGRKVRLTVRWSGEPPRTFEGEYSVEGDKILARFPGEPEVAYMGTPGLLRVGIEDGALSALIGQHAERGQFFQFEKK